MGRRNHKAHALIEKLLSESKEGMTALHLHDAIVLDPLGKSWASNTTRISQLLRHKKFMKIRLLPCRTAIWGLRDQHSYLLAENAESTEPMEEPQ